MEALVRRIGAGALATLYDATKKKWVAEYATHFFLAALRSPRTCRKPSSYWAYAMQREMNTRIVLRHVWVLRSPQSVPRSTVPTAGKLFQQSQFFHRKTNHSL